MESDWPPEAGAMPSDVNAAIELFNDHHNGCEHIWLSSTPIKARYSE